MTTSRFVAALALSFLPAVGVAPSVAEAATFNLMCGAKRIVNLSRPKPAVFRISNGGDCSATVMGFNSNGQLRLSIIVRPGQTRDIRSASVRLQSVILMAGTESTVGAHLVAGRLLDNVVVSVPLMGTYPCGTLTDIFDCGDGTGCQQVTYRVENTGACDVIVRQVTVSNPQPPPVTLTSGMSGDFSGDYTDFRVDCAGTASQGCTFSYTRNPL